MLIRSAKLAIGRRRGSPPHARLAAFVSLAFASLCGFNLAGSALLWGAEAKSSSDRPATGLPCEPHHGANLFDLGQTPSTRSPAVKRQVSFAREGPANQHVQAPCERGLNGVRPQDSVWMFSTRSMSCCGQPTGEPELFRLEGLRWVSVEQSQLNSALPSGEVVIYVHGNRMEFNNAAERGRRYYEQVAAGEPPPICFIIWSWPSDQIRGTVKDVRAKAARADCETQILADFLVAVPQDSTVLLIGFSFGARIISGALSQAVEFGTPCPDARAVFLAPAMPTEWLGPNQHHWRAWEKMKQLLIFHNSCDRALKRFRFSDPCYRPQALGYTGPWWGDQTPGVVEHEDVCCLIGKAHEELSYLASPYLMNRLRWFLGPQPQAAVTSALRNEQTRLLRP